MADGLLKFEFDVTGALDGLSTRQTQLTPLKAPQKWSIQQIIEHLLLSYTVTEAVLLERLTKRRPTKARPGLRQLLAQWAIIGRGRYPRGLSAPASVQPVQLLSLQSGPELAERMHTELQVIDVQLQRCQQLFGDKRAASHLVLGPLSAEQWRKFHVVHGRHHLQQIARIRQEHKV